MDSGAGQELGTAAHRCWDSGGDGLAVYSQGGIRRGGDEGVTHPPTRTTRVHVHLQTPPPKGFDATEATETAGPPAAALPPPSSPPPPGPLPHPPARLRPG